MQPLLILAICALCVFTEGVFLQSVGVRGVLMCGNKPLANTRVKLWDEDDGPDPDEELAATYTDAQGRFNVSGGTHETSSIDPRLKIYHDCDDWLFCQRKIKLMIPKRYVNQGNAVSKWFDAGVMNMELVFQDEERDCGN
uniref:Uncharacterized protein n=1 Tax=Plectus sambesii TaxID=2011161 RepID=A0A914X7B8_9BILA